MEVFHLCSALRNTLSVLSLEWLGLTRTLKAKGSVERPVLVKAQAMHPFQLVIHIYIRNMYMVSRSMITVPPMVWGGYAIRYYTIRYDTILYYTILYYPILSYTILSYPILYYTILYYTILYYTILGVSFDQPENIKGSSCFRSIFCVQEPAAQSGRSLAQLTSEMYRFLLNQYNIYIHHMRSS